MTKLEKKRNEMNMKISVLSQLSGVNHCQITTYEKGYGRPSYRTAQKLANALDSNIGEIFPQYNNEVSK